MTITQKYAQVIVDIPALELNMRTFSYLIPDELRDKISIGSPVSIPFGRQDPVFGYVVGFSDYLEEGIKVKPIFEVLDDSPLFDLKYLEFIEWVSNYYLSTLVSTISAAIPSGLWSSTKRVVNLTEDITDANYEKLNTSEQKIIDAIKSVKKQELTPTSISKKTKIPRSKLYGVLRSLKARGVINIQNIIDGARAKPRLIEYVLLLEEKAQTRRHEEVLKILANQPDGRMETKELVDKAKTTRTTIKKLESLGNVKFVFEEAYRNPLDRFSGVSPAKELTLTAEQRSSLDYIFKSLQVKDDPGPILMHGVAGSGKTEVYFRVIEQAIIQGQSAIFLVPEITLTSQISERMIARFGPEKVGIWHSSLSAGERLDIWKRIHAGEIKIVLGARSAVFAPVRNLGLIVIDEEHESAYKQDTPSPRYHAREVALERAKRYNAKVIMGSATPDVQSYYLAKQNHSVLVLPYRIEKRPMAEVRLVDMKIELESGNKSIFSRVLSYEIQETVKNRHQVILLINRRGFTTYVFCRSCGYVAECKNCSIPLIYHFSTGEMRCHYCNYKQPSYEVCPECSSRHIKHYGTGTQKVEQEMLKKFPDIKVLRLDSDVTSRKNAHYEVIESFESGEADVLIGTQMVAKGLDLHNVTLVGVLASDSSFTFPDYRAMERGFQLLTQVAGRAGRGQSPGRVVFQCYSPHIYPIACAQKQDYGSFYSLEIVEREKYGYPPFSQLVRIILTSEDYETTFVEAMRLTNFLMETFKEYEEKIKTLGPSDCIIAKIQNKFRMQILLKNLMGQQGHSLITTILKNYRAKNVTVIVDVDPLNML